MHTPQPIYMANKILLHFLHFLHLNRLVRAYGIRSKCWVWLSFDERNLLSDDRRLLSGNRRLLSGNRSLLPFVRSLQIQVQKV